MSAPVCAPAGGRVGAAVAALAGGEPVVLSGGPGGESVLVLAAELATPRTVAMVVRHTSGVLRCALEAPLFDRLGLEDAAGVDAARGVQSGVSAADRARTLRVLADRSSRADDVVRPGHVFPAHAATDGLAGAGVRLLRLARLRPAAAVAELLAEDGSVATPAQARRFAANHELVLIDLDELRGAGTALLRLAAARMPTRHGDFRAEAFATLEQPDRHHLALVHGDLQAAAPLISVHEACPAGERFGSLLCDCAQRLHTAMEAVAAAGAGVVVYLRTEQDGALACPRDRTPVDLQTAAAILRALNVRAPSSE